MNIKRSELEKYDLISERSNDDKEDVKTNVENIIAKANNEENKENNLDENKEINEKVFESEMNNLKNKIEKTIKEEKLMENDITKEIKNPNVRKISVEEKQDISVTSNNNNKDQKISKKEREMINLSLAIKNETFPKRILTLIYEIIYTFLFSLYPNWCDEFEQNNPIIVRENRKVLDLSRTKVEDENQDTSNNNNKENNNNLIIEEENKIIIENIDMTKNSIDFTNYNRNFEKIILKSNSDTRKVNNDDDQTKYLLVEENENRTENEFVFSENINIDNLSCINEPITESKKNSQTNVVLEKKKID